MRRNDPDLHKMLIPSIYQSKQCIPSPDFLTVPLCVYNCALNVYVSVGVYHWQQEHANHERLFGFRFCLMAIDIKKGEKRFLHREKATPFVNDNSPRR